MRVSRITKAEVEDGVEWSATVTFADQERIVRFGGPAELVGGTDASMFLAATLLPAMAWQQDLQIDGPVSAALLARVDRLARTYRLMDPTLRHPRVEVAAAVEHRSAGTATASFFSRGVDSTFSAALPRTEPAPLDALLYCRTLEPVHDLVNRDLELAMAATVAERIGLPIRPIWTDLRGFTDPMLGWSAMHGAGLASLALLVSPAFAHVIVPPAYDIASLAPCGSHPLVDPLFSSESTTVHHDHMDRGRQGKLDWLVAERPDLVEHLKVCYSDNRVDNCGRCHKCLLTMSGLRAAGGLHLAAGFPLLELDRVGALRVANVGLRNLWLAIARRAADQGDHELVDAVSDALRLSARPTLRELAGGRSRVLDLLLGTGEGPGYDPEAATTFERFDRVTSNSTLAMVRHGEVLDLRADPPPRRLRASTVAGSLAASIGHRRARRRGR